MLSATQFKPSDNLLLDSPVPPTPPDAPLSADFLTDYLRHRTRPRLRPDPWHPFCEIDVLALRTLEKCMPDDPVSLIDAAVLFPPDSLSALLTDASATDLLSRDIARVARLAARSAKVGDAELLVDCMDVLLGLCRGGQRAAVISAVGLRGEPKEAAERALSWHALCTATASQAALAERYPCGLPRERYLLGVGIELSDAILGVPPAEAPDTPVGHRFSVDADPDDNEPGVVAVRATLPDTTPVVARAALNETNGDVDAAVGLLLDGWTPPSRAIGKHESRKRGVHIENANTFAGEGSERVDPGWITRRIAAETARTLAAGEDGAGAYSFLVDAVEEDDPEEDAGAEDVLPLSKRGAFPTEAEVEEDEPEPPEVARLNEQMPRQGFGPNKAPGGRPYRYGTGPAGSGGSSGAGPSSAGSVGRGRGLGRGRGRGGRGRGRGRGRGGRRP